MEGYGDPFHIIGSMLKVHQSWLNEYPEYVVRLKQLSESLQETGVLELESILAKADVLKQTPEYNETVIVDFVRLCLNSAKKFHVIFEKWIGEFIADAPDLDEKDIQRSAFWAKQCLDMIAPNNIFWLNPGAVQRFLKSNGKSLVKGFENFLDDLRRGDCMVKLVDESAFVLGENLASTPGSIVYRNDLMELIQYAPVTETVYSTPVVFIQPWINKYYIFDLSKYNSFVQYLVKQGFTVFITSWRNPSAEMRKTTLDDYMLKGALKAVEAACEICNVPYAHAAGYCIGGTVLAALMAWLNADGNKNASIPIKDWTLFSTLIDFSEPGNLGLFFSDESFEAIETLLKKDGYLDSSYIGFSFRLLNADGLIWRYVANNYLFGEQPPKSDMLYWNSDGTRLPEAMCSFYLREFYLNNTLAKKNGFVIGGRQIDLDNIRQPLYAVAAIQDHISPWKGAYRSCNLLQCPVKFVLSSEGHIMGIVNPPSPRSKRKYFSGEPDKHITPDEWQLGREEQRGSWWPDWVNWLIEKDDTRIAAPPTGSSKYPVLDDAPGIYVLER